MCFSDRVNAESYQKTLRKVILPWPAKSPDLNPIENMRSIVKRGIPVSLSATGDLKERGAGLGTSARG